MTRSQLALAAGTPAAARTELGTERRSCEITQAAVLLLGGSSTVVLADVQQCMVISMAQTVHAAVSSAIV
jgi:hypothetical protein